MATQSQSSARPSEGFAQRLKEDGRRTLEQRKRSAAQRVEEIAQAIDRTGAQFDDNEPTIADLAHRLASTVGNIATRLREGSFDDLLQDTRSFARRNPALFVVGGVAAGFVLARFAKASASRLERPVSAADDAPTLTEEVTASATVGEQSVAAPPQSGG